MRQTSLLALFGLLIFTPACPGPADPADVGGVDAATLDSGASDDAGSDSGSTDTGVTDSGVTDSGDGGATDSGIGDAGADAPRSPACPPGLGELCEDSGTCPSPYECDIGRCRPQGRPLCGGFAGATCDTAPYTACLYNDMADFGACLTPAEVECICADPELSRDVVCS